MAPRHHESTQLIPQGRAVTRRELLRSVPALLLAPKLAAQSAGARIRVRGFNHLTLTVSDVKRSVEFYQGLFGMPIQARQGAATVALRIGQGPQALALTGGANARPSINHFCFGVDDFDVERLLKLLAEQGITRSDQAGGGLTGGPMKARVRMRGPEAGGAKEGTPELYFADPDGIIVQLQDPSYCGGGGTLGNVCSPQAAPSKGLLGLRDLNHVTVFVSDGPRSNALYRQLFGFGIRSYQGPDAPTLAVGGGVQFAMLAGGGPARGGAGGQRPAGINHLAMSIENFNHERVLKTLESYGIKPREGATAPVPPLHSYVTMRMENRGGARDGTPELYFTDPDGILIQLQDVSYCGGSGYLGNLCSGR